MANEKISQLPTVTSALSADLIAAVQGGQTVQETLGQVTTLVRDGIILTYAGNPNGNVSGTVYQLLWDSTHSILYVCTTSGSELTSVWKPSIGQLTNGQVLIGSTGLSPVAATLTAGSNISITNSAGGIVISAIGEGGYTWTEVTTTSQSMAIASGYVANNAALVTLTLPSTSAIGDSLAIVGKGAGLWLIAQNASQIIHIGSSATTTGVSGSVAATNRYDSLELICTVANLEWTILGAPQGVLTIV